MLRPRSWRRPAAAVTALIVGATLAAACAPGPGPVSGPRVLLVGDSLMASAEQQVADALRAQGWDPVVKSFGGTTIEDWVSSMPSIVAETHPNVAVIELGTNDCGPYIPCWDLGPYIDAVMRALTMSADAVLWLNVQEQGFAPTDWDYVNSAIAAADVRWPEMFVVDMNARLGGHPEWHMPDQRHFNDAGKEQFASLIADSLRPFHPRQLALGALAHEPPSPRPVASPGARRGS